MCAIMGVFMLAMTVMIGVTVLTAGVPTIDTIQIGRLDGANVSSVTIGKGTYILRSTRLGTINVTTTAGGDVMCTMDAVVPGWIEIHAATTVWQSPPTVTCSCESSQIACEYHIVTG